MEISPVQLIPAILAGFAGLAGSACAWFAFARQLVTRAEAERMVRDRVDAFQDQMKVWTKHQCKQERTIDDMRSELVALRGEVIKLGVLLETARARDCGSSAGGNETKGN